MSTTSCSFIRLVWLATLCLSTGSGENGDKAVDGAISDAVARWLHHRYALVELPTAGGVYCFTITDIALALHGRSSEK